MSQKLFLTKEAHRLIPWGIANFSDKKNNELIEGLVRIVKETAGERGIEVISVTHTARFQPHRIDYVDLKGNGVEGGVYSKSSNRQDKKNAQVVVDLEVGNDSLYGALNQRLSQYIN